MGRLPLYGLIGALACCSTAAAAERGEVTTLWPLFDYRSSPADGYSNLSLFGPLFKRERKGDSTATALRPLFFSTSTAQGEEETDLLYPLASVSSDGERSDSQVLKLFQRHTSGTGTPAETSDTMLFPLYISGVSGQHGPYTSIFPLYGDIYGRFWRDEYHFVLFPLYSRTVRGCSTSTNWLYPIFNTVSGEDESGFAVWPLYGESEKKGVYRKRFALWPLFSSETRTDSQGKRSESLNLLPFYASSSSPQKSSTHIPWPLTGVVRDGSGRGVERDYLWPLWMTASGEDSESMRLLPFYAASREKGRTSHWYLWPLYRQQAVASDDFRMEKHSLLYFLFNRSDEQWPRSGVQRSQSTLWPLYAWKRDEQGVRSLTLPAPVEPVVWSDGVERNWAPLWRLFAARWDERGSSAMSLFWNLYWHEIRKDAVAWELSPLVSWRSDARGSELKILKGLFGWEGQERGSVLSLFWIPFGGGEPQ